MTTRIKTPLTDKDFLINKNSHRQETPKQRYWRIRWAEAPREQRENLKQFYKMLEQEKESLPYRLVTYAAIKKNKNEFEWDKWYIEELYNSMDEKVKEKLLDDEIRILDIASTTAERFSRDLEISSRQFRDSKINLDITDSKSIDKACKISYMYTNELKHLNSCIENINNSYLSLKDLSDINSKKKSPFMDILKLSIEYNKQNGKTQEYRKEIATNTTTTTTTGKQENTED